VGGRDKEREERLHAGQGAGPDRLTRYPISTWEMTVSILSSPISLAISLINIQDDHIDVVDNHIDTPYPKSISHITYRYSYRCLISNVDPPYRSPISISDDILSLRGLEYAQQSTLRSI
jgi:hypothetical protein